MKKIILTFSLLFVLVQVQAQEDNQEANPVGGGSVSLDVESVTTTLMDDDTYVVVFPQGSDQTFTVPDGVTSVDYLVVGGGGAGGHGGNGPLDTAAGGGAGGRVLSGTLINLTPGATLSITVGAGGSAGSTSIAPTAGGNSTLTYDDTTYTAPGGGYGASETYHGGNGANAVNGGGASSYNGDSNGSWAYYTGENSLRGGENSRNWQSASAQVCDNCSGPFNCCSRTETDSDYYRRLAAGGGAGDSDRGDDGDWGSKAGNGGSGTSSILTGESITFGGGGGGGYYSRNSYDSYRGGIGQDGGGDGRSRYENSSNLYNTHNQGSFSTYTTSKGYHGEDGRGGGGGGGTIYLAGGDGGDGVVVLRYTAIESINYFEESVDYLVLDMAHGYTLSQVNTFLNDYSVKLINGGTLVIDEAINTSNYLIIEANTIDVQANITAGDIQLYTDALTATADVDVETGKDFTYAPYPDGDDEYGFPNDVTWPISNLTLARVPGRLILGEEFDGLFSSPTYSGDITINDDLTVGKGLEVFAKNITLDGTTEGGANKTIEVQDSYNGSFYKINLVASQNIYQYNMDITTKVWTYYLANKDESADGGLVHIKGTESNPVVINMLDGKLRIAEVNDAQYLNCSTTPLTIGEGGNTQTLYTAIALENCTITGNVNFADDVKFMPALNATITPENGDYPAYSMVTAGNVQIDLSTGEINAIANAQNDYDQETGAIWFDVLNTNPTVLKNAEHIRYYISGDCAANQYGIKGDFKIIKDWVYNGEVVDTDINLYLIGYDQTSANDVTAASNWFHPDVNAELLNPGGIIELNFNGNNNLGAPQGTFLLGYKEGSAVTSSDADFNLVSSAGNTMSFFEDMDITYNATGGKFYFNIDGEDNGPMVWPLPENINITGTISDLHLKNTGQETWHGGSIQINEDIVLSGDVRLNALGKTITAQSIECNTLQLESDIEIAAGKHIETSDRVWISENGADIHLKANSTEMATVVGTIQHGVFSRLIIERPVNGAPGNDLVSHSMLQTQTFNDFINQNPDLVYGGSIGGTPNYYLFGSYDQASRSYLYFNTNGNVYNAETGSHITDGSISTDIVSGRGYRIGAVDANTNGHDIVEFRTTLPSNTTSFNTDQTVALTVTELNEPFAGWTTTNNSWNLLGNPFPAYLDMNSILTANQDVLHEESQAIYGYNGNGGWRIFNLATSINKYIAPGQGFFVRGPETEGSNFTFLASAQATYTDANNSDDFVAGRSASSTNDVYYTKLLLGNGDQTGDTYLYFLQQGSNGLDAGYDSSTWESQIPEFGIYSNLIENNQGVPMAIQTLNTSALFDQGVIIPLGVETASGIQLTFSLDQLDTQLPDGAVIILEDNVTNTFTDLATQDYIVQADSDLSGIGRFYIHVGENTTLSNTEVAYQNLQVYAPKGSGTIEISGMVESGMSMQVYDMLGRNVMSTALQATQGTQSVPAGHLTDGAYIVYLKGTKGTRSVKLVITK